MYHDFKLTVGVSNKILFLDEMMLFNERLASSADEALLQLDLAHHFLQCVIQFPLVAEIATLNHSTLFTLSVAVRDFNLSYFYPNLKYFSSPHPFVLTTSLQT